MTFQLSVMYVQKSNWAIYSEICLSEHTFEFSIRDKLQKSYCNPEANWHYIVQITFKPVRCVYVMMDELL